MELDSLDTAVKTSVEWYRSRDKARFLVVVPKPEDRLNVALHTIGELLHPWEHALLLTNQEGVVHYPNVAMIRGHDLSALDVAVQYTMLLIDGASAKEAKFYQKLASVLNPYSLWIGYPAHYREERYALSSLFPDGLAYFMEDEEEGFKRGMKFYVKASLEKPFSRSHVEVVPRTASKQVFADPTYEQDMVWDGLVEQKTA